MNAAKKLPFSNSRLYAISLKGGSPFDKEIQPHPTAIDAKNQSGNFLQNILAAERVAKVVVRVTSPNAEMLEQLELVLFEQLKLNQKTFLIK